MSATQQIEDQMRQYAEVFLRTEYGNAASEILSHIKIVAVNAIDTGGISEATDDHIQIAAKRDFASGKLTGTTKLILRHELGHIIDNSPAFVEFKEEIEHEKKAWVNAKPKNAAENWFRNISIRTHIDPLKMQSMGFPCPERKLSSEQLEQGTAFEVERMKKGSRWVDVSLAKRYAMANLLENPDCYGPT